MYIIIYLIGVVFSFILGRHTFRMASKGSYDYGWDLALFNIGLSVCSWMSFVALFIVFLIQRDWGVSKKTGKPKTPPRWL